MFFSICSLYSIGTLHLACCTGGKAGSVPDGIGPGHVTYSFKRVRKGSFQCYNVLDLGCGVRGSCWGQLCLWAVENWLWATGKGAFARVECLMVLEEGEFGSGVCFVVLKWLKLPTLTSSLPSMSWKGWKWMEYLHPCWRQSSSCHGSRLRGGCITACAGLCCLCDWVPKGRLFSSLPLAARGGNATWSKLVVAAKLGT